MILMLKRIMSKKGDRYVISPHPLPLEEKRLPSKATGICYKPVTFNNLVYALRSKRWTVDPCPAWEIPRIGGPIIEILSSIMDNGSTETRMEVAKVLGQIHSKEAHKALKIALSGVGVGTRIDEENLRTKILRELEGYKKRSKSAERCTNLY